MKCNECSKCPKTPCRDALPVIGIEEMPNNIATLKYNFDGVTTFYDYTSMIKQTETDTSLRAKSTDRTLIYTAERHTDTISSKELGSIFHLTDLGDVDGSGLDSGSMLVYHKDNNCSQGCEGISNSWVVWNPDENQTDSLTYLMGYDGNNTAYTLSTPAHSNQYYQLGWNASHKVSYSQPTETTVSAVTNNNKVLILVMDPNTKQVLSLKVSANKLQELVG